MKKLTTLLILLLTVFGNICANEEKSGVQFVPQYIIEGTKNNQVIYNPAGTILENETNIKCVIYYWMPDFHWEAFDLPITQKEGKWIGTFNAPKEASLLTCKFYSGDKTDYGWPATYTSFILDKNKNNKPTANIGWALLRSDESKSIPGLLADSAATPIAGDVVMMWFNNEFQRFNSQLPHTFGLLVKALNRYKRGEKNDILRQNIEQFLANDKLKLSNQDWVDIYEVAKFTLSDKELAARIEQKEKEEYPDGILSRDKEVWRISQLFVKEQDQAQKDFKKFMKRFPTKKFLNARSQNTDLFYSKIFRSVIYDRIMRADDYSNLKKFIHDIPYNELITTHWHVVEVCFNNGQVTPEKLLPHSTLIINEMMTRPQLTNAQKLYSPTEWESVKLQKYSMALFAHARILAALGQTDEAYRYAQMVYPFYTNKTTPFTEFYSGLLQKKNMQEELVEYIKGCVNTNAVTQEMLDILKADYLKTNDASGFEAYLDSFRNKDKETEAKEHAISQIINEPINLYELDKLGGGRVNLADKKGKILFIDFWATWCGPCKASMPGGQMAVDRYKDDPNVEFYFIDTNETAKNYRQKVADFIKSKGYTFNVLFDEGEPGKQDKVFKDYCKSFHTSGIPLKMIIDGEGRLRWMQGGYHGSPVGMANEIGYIIEHLKQEKK